MHSLLMDINGMVYLPVDATMLDNPFIYKLVPCQHFLQGLCNKSDAVCKFSHGSMLPLPTYSHPQSYWYNVTLDPSTSKWTMESIPDSAPNKQPPAISMATGLPLVNRKQQQMPSGFQPGFPYKGYPGPGVMGAKPVGFPGSMGRQGTNNSSYQGRAKYGNSPATHSQQASGQRRGKKQLASRQPNPSYQAFTGNPARSVDVTTDTSSLVQSLNSMKINSADSDASSVSSWASLSSKVSTSKSIPTFSRTNFPGLPGSNNEDKRSEQSSGKNSLEVAAPPRGAWAFGGPQQRITPAKLSGDSSGAKSSETSEAKSSETSETESSETSPAEKHI